MADLLAWPFVVEAAELRKMVCKRWIKSRREDDHKSVGEAVERVLECIS